jgi:hypothetical protein
MGLRQTLHSFFQHTGTREQVRRSYAEHCVHSSLPVGTPPHRAGLYGALRDSHVQHGRPAHALYLWAELTPFLLMSEETACAALAEYIVYQDLPQSAQVSWLAQVINAALRLPALSKDSPRTMAPLAMIKNVAWCDLLEAYVRRTIEKEAEQVREALADNNLPLLRD